MICNEAKNISLLHLSKYLDSKVQILLLDPFDRSKINRPRIKEDIYDYLLERSLKFQDLSIREDVKDEEKKETNRESLFNIICIMRQYLNDM